MHWTRCTVALTAIFTALHILPPPRCQGLVLNANHPAGPPLAPTWEDLQTRLSSTRTGSRLIEQALLRSQGRGSPHVGAKIRLFHDDDDDVGKSANEKGKNVRVMLYRDSAAWCVYCQKVWIALEEKRIPYNITTIPLNAYGDKPVWFTRLVEGGKLPAIELDGELVTESLEIIARLEKEFPEHRLVPEPGSPNSDRYEKLMELEKELQSAWFSLVFYPVEGDAISRTRTAFLDTVERVDEALGSTPGPWLLGGNSLSFVDIHHICHFERITASVLYWKGIQLRGTRFPNLDTWLAAFEKQPSYKATQSDAYTLVLAIPSQNGPGYSIPEAQDIAAKICGLDGAWSIDTVVYTPSDAQEAAFQLISNHKAIVEFCTRGAGEPGRPSFHAELSDPYAEPNYDYIHSVDICLRHVTAALLHGSDDDIITAAARNDLAGQAGDGTLRESWGEYTDTTGRSYWWNEVTGEVTWTAPTMQLDTCLTYLRDRVGVPRDMSMGAAMQLRAHLNWAIDLLNEQTQ